MLLLLLTDWRLNSSALSRFFPLPRAFFLSYFLLTSNELDCGNFFYFSFLRPDRASHSLDFFFSLTHSLTRICSGHKQSSWLNSLTGGLASKKATKKSTFYEIERKTWIFFWRGRNFIKLRGTFLREFWEIFGDKNWEKLNGNWKY